VIVPQNADRDDDLTLQREVALLLTVDPSPEFTAGVRARIAQVPTDVGIRPWRLASASAAVLLVVAAIGLLFDPAIDHGASMDSTVVATDRSVAPMSPLTASTRHTVRQTVEPNRRTPASRRAVIQQRVLPVEVLISPDEAAGLELLRAQVSAAEWRASSRHPEEISEREPGAPFDVIAISRIEIPRLQEEASGQGVHQ
jgi:hypothetical protein